MLQKTKGIVLRSVKYGETSLITTIFTATFGVQAYMVKGVRNPKSKRNKAGLLQPSTILDLVVYQQPQKNINRIQELQPAYIYTSLREEIIKNSIALFSTEVLLRLLPEHAIQPELFDFAAGYLIQIDEMKNSDIANFPLYFIIQCSHILGYTIKGNYSKQTPYLNLQEGGFSAHPSPLAPHLSDEETQIMHSVLQVHNQTELKHIDMNSAMRYKLIEWYIAFLHTHTQHFGVIKSLPILQAVLH